MMADRKERTTHEANEPYQQTQLADKTTLGFGKNETSMFYPKRGFFFSMERPDDHLIAHLSNLSISAFGTYLLLSNRQIWENNTLPSLTATMVLEICWDLRRKWIGIWVSSQVAEDDACQAGRNA